MPPSVGGLEAPVDRGADPAREAADRGPLDAAAGLEGIDAQLERLGPVGPKPKLATPPVSLGDIELVGPVAREAVLRGERVVDVLGLGVDGLEEVDGGHGVSF